MDGPSSISCEPGSCWPEEGDRAGCTEATEEPVLALLIGNLVTGLLGLGGVIYLLARLLAGVGAVLLARYLTPYVATEQDRDEITAALKKP